MPEPEITFNHGSCSASIFGNEINQDGKTVVIKKTVLQKRYIDKEEKWQHTNSYDINDLPKLILCAVKAYDYMTTRDSKKAGY